MGLAGSFTADVGGPDYVPCEKHAKSKPKGCRASGIHWFWAGAEASDICSHVLSRFRVRVVCATACRFRRFVTASLVRPVTAWTK